MKIKSSLWSDPFISPSPREFYTLHFLRQILICAYTIYQISDTWTIPSGYPSPPSHVYSGIPFMVVYNISLFWRSRDELISDVLLWTPTYGQARAGRPARTYIQQLCEDTGCSPEDLPEAMNDREKWRKRVRDICASGMTWWWWWYD